MDRANLNHIFVPCQLLENHISIYWNISHYHTSSLKCISEGRSSSLKVQINKFENYTYGTISKSFKRILDLVVHLVLFFGWMSQEYHSKTFGSTILPNICPFVQSTSIMTSWPPAHKTWERGARDWQFCYLKNRNSNSVHLETILEEFT